MAGLLSCQLRLYGEDDALILSPRFSLLVRPSVYGDDSVIESENEVSALTALVSEAQEIIDEVRQNLTDGAFVPQLSIGTVETLPAGQMAEVSLSGTGESPVLNFKIPQGPIGTNEEHIPDSALSESSTRPVQNRVITEALSKKLEKTEFQQTIANYALQESLSNFVESEEFASSMENKVDKEEGKFLMTEAERLKLQGIEEGATKLTDSSVTTAKIADLAVTAAKLSSDAKSKAVTASLAAASWSNKSQTVSVTGVTADNNVLVAAAPASRTAWNDAEVYCSAQAAGTLTFTCSTVPTAALTANVIILV